MRRAAGGGHFARPEGEARPPPSNGAAAICNHAMSATVISREARTRLDSVHYALEGFWKRLGESAPEDWKMLFELAVCEIAANIIEHARADVMEFDIRITIDGSQVVAEFIDTGRPYADATSPKPRPAKRGQDYDERGRGLALAETVLDELVYERTGTTNSWRLVKEL